MPLTFSRRLPQAALIAIAALGVTLGAAQVAHAFTFSTADGSTAAGGAQFQDPDQQLQGTTSHDGSVTMRAPGGTSVQFGARNAQSSFDAQYNSGVNRLFSPYGRDAR